MRILITGGKGFIGAALVRRLAALGHDLVVFDVADDRRLVAAIAGTAHTDAATWIVGDIVDSAAVDAAARGCDAIIHLAGVLTPECKANPRRGAEINLIGTLNVFEAARAHGIPRLVYTSSAGVFGADNGHTPLPQTHYGAFKLATEGCARAYWVDHRIASVGFRPYIVYGPGRETGLTAGPSLACRAAARGSAYVIPYRATAGLVFVDDVAGAFEAAVLRPPKGAHVFNLGGVVASNDDIVREILKHEPGASIIIDGPTIPMVPALAEDALDDILPGLPLTSLSDGIAQTLAFYRTSTI